MKNVRRTALPVILSLLLILSATSFAEGRNVVGVLTGNENFSILLSALGRAGLADTLQGEGPFTLFAPTNEAFQKLFEELQISAERLLEHPQLADVLLYHVVAGELMSAELSEDITAQALNEQELTVSLTGGVRINSSNVTTADIQASNGIIHVIDAVLVPPTFQASPQILPPMTVTDFVRTNPDFAILTSALESAGLAESLRSEGPFTLFAPTDKAFMKLLESLQITAEDLLGHPQLADVLLNHVVAGNLLSTDLRDGMTEKNLLGQEIRVNLDDGVKINESFVTLPDNIVFNGVIHVIDAVLLPGTFQPTP